MKGYFREKSKSQNINPISPTHKSTLGIIQVTTKACQLCRTPYLLVSTCLVRPDARVCVRSKVLLAFCSILHSL